MFSCVSMLGRMASWVNIRSSLCSFLNGLVVHHIGINIREFDQREPYKDIQVHQAGALFQVGGPFIVSELVKCG